MDNTGKNLDIGKIFFGEKPQEKPMNLLTNAQAQAIAEILKEYTYEAKSLKLVEEACGRISKELSPKFLVSYLPSGDSNILEILILDIETNKHTIISIEPCKD